MDKPFVHLHLHSQYSLLESSVWLDELTAAAASLKMPAVAVTDHGNMFGAIEFYMAAKKAGVKPILGCEVYIAPGSRMQKGAQGRGASASVGAGGAVANSAGAMGVKGGASSAGIASSPNIASTAGMVSAASTGRHAQPHYSRLVLLAMNLNGYHNLCQLVSRGYTEGFYYKPRIDYEILEQFSGDLIALTSSQFGDVPYEFTTAGPEKALEKIKYYKKIFGDRFYLEMQRTGATQWEAINKFFIEASKITGVPYIATNDVHYLKREDSFAHEILMCIGAGKTLIDEKRPRLPSDQFYFKSQAEMYELFKDLPQACERTLEVAERCNVDFKFSDEKGNTIYHLPTFPTQGRSVDDEIRTLAQEGLQERFKEMAARSEAPSDDDRPKYFDRLKYELSVINRMGFNGYFLIVQDFINWAKSQGIPVGPGRGSGAGSLVAYSLRITDLDPLRYNLLFERFLNPERISMPDFDVDFCQDRRGEVIQYVTQRYGHESVAQIITFGKLQAKAAVRDVGRGMGMSYGEVDFIAKLIPEKLGISLQEAIDTEPRLKELKENDPKIQSLLESALKLEGLTRHASIHAAGVIISDRPLVEHCPLYKGNEGETVVQFDMIHAEKIGLIKFDFLGLKTLTMIENAVKLIRKNRPEGLNLSTQSISMTDPKIYELLSSGDTAGVFQFEGEGISEFIRKFKPTCFEDITAINALYRPGPMDMLDEYVARKKGEIKVRYLFPELEEILQETYGIIVYQEQVQLIASKIANYSLGEADILRRAMGKKKPEEMAKQKARFMKGAAENKHDLKKADELFELMAKFAGYGFNKSHAAAYCVVAAQTAYLKSYYPVEFYASLISTEMGNTDKIVQYIRDAGEHRIKVRGPDINASEWRFSVLNDEILFGLGGIKGVGEAAVQAIVDARMSLPGQQFESLLQFFETVDLRRVNKKVIECLIKAGAFDLLHDNRAQLYTGFEKYLDAAESTRRDKEVGQSSFFDIGPGVERAKIELPEIEKWSRSQKLANEKEVLGFYISDHPLSGYESILKNHVTCTIRDLSEQPSKKKVVLGGIISGLKEFITKKGDRMAFAQLEDQAGMVELVIFPKAYLKAQDLLKTGRPLICVGLHEREEDQSKVLVDEFYTIESLTSRARELIVRLDASRFDNQAVKKLEQVFLRHKGGIRSRVDLVLPEQKQIVTLELGPEYSVSPSEAFFEDLERQLGSNGLATIA